MWLHNKSGGITEAAQEQLIHNLIQIAASQPPVAMTRTSQINHGLLTPQVILQNAATIQWEPNKNYMLYVPLSAAQVSQF